MSQSYSLKKIKRALNRVLLDQLLQKQIGLNNTDLIKIQDTCPFLRRMKELALNLKTHKFKVYEKILYRTEIVLGSEICKLALPVNFAQQVLYNSHYTMSKHMSAQSHADTFSANFYVKNCLELAKRVVKKCVTC